MMHTLLRYHSHVDAEGCELWELHEAGCIVALLLYHKVSGLRTCPLGM